MSDLIKRKDAIKLVKRAMEEGLIPTYYLGLAPTIDAVIMVRCKDCRFGTWDEDVEMYDCELHKGIFEAQHYCRDGERWENEAD